MRDFTVIKNTMLINFRSQLLDDGKGSIAVTLILTAMVTLFLTSALALIVAESSLPKPIKRLSYTLVHDRSKRNTVICITFCFMCVATTLAVVSIFFFLERNECKNTQID